MILKVIIMDQLMIKQPWGISLNCLVLAISAVVSLFGAIALTVAGTAATASITTLTGIGVTNIASYITIGAVFLIVMVIVAVALLYGLWIHDDRAWWICLILLVLGIVADVVALAFFGVDVVAITFIILGINVLLILGLLHRDTIAAIRPDIDWPGWILED